MAQTVSVTPSKNSTEELLLSVILMFWEQLFCVVRFLPLLGGHLSNLTSVILWNEQLLVEKFLLLMKNFNICSAQRSCSVISIPRSVQPNVVFSILFKVN